MALLLPRLECEHLILRAFGPEDVSTVLEASTDPRIPAITTVPSHPDSAAAAVFIQRQHQRAETGEGYSFAIATAAGEAAIGQIGLWPLSRERASIGYWIVPSARGRGVATSALVALSRWGLELPGVHRLELYAEPRNRGSCRTAEKAGYYREGLLRGWQEVHGERRDMYMYSLLRTDGELFGPSSA